MKANEKNSAAALVAKIRANDRALARCAGHDFTEISPATFAPWVFGLEVFLACVHCKGEVPAAVAQAYETGLEHGRRRVRR